MAEKSRRTGLTWAEAQTFASLSAEGRYINEFNREAQASHLGGEQIPLTRIAVTDPGREAVERHWQQLERLRSKARRWVPRGTD